jgi:hypothetical protein
MVMFLICAFNALSPRLQSIISIEHIFFMCEKARRAGD